MADEKKWTTKTLLIYLKCILFYLWKTYFPSEKNGLMNFMKTVFFYIFFRPHKKPFSKFGSLFVAKERFNLHVPNTYCA